MPRNAVSGTTGRVSALCMLVWVWGLTPGWGGTDTLQSLPAPGAASRGCPDSSCSVPQASHSQGCLTYGSTALCLTATPEAASLTHTAPGWQGAGARGWAGHQGSSVLGVWRIQSLCVGQGKCCEVRVVQPGFFLCPPGLQDSSNHQKNKAFEFQTENARNLKEAETLLKDLFLDVDRAKRLRHPQAPEIEKE